MSDLCKNTSNKLPVGYWDNIQSEYYTSPLINSLHTNIDCIPEHIIDKFKSPTEFARFKEYFVEYQKYNHGDNKTIMPLQTFQENTMQENDKLPSESDINKKLEILVQKNIANIQK